MTREELLDIEVSRSVWEPFTKPDIQSGKSTLIGALSNYLAENNESAPTDEEYMHWTHRIVLWGAGQDIVLRESHHIGHTLNYSQVVKQVKANLNPQRPAKFGVIESFGATRGAVPDKDPVVSELGLIASGDGKRIIAPDSHTHSFDSPPSTGPHSHNVSAHQAALEAHLPKNTTFGIDWSSIVDIPAFFPAPPITLSIEGSVIQEGGTLLRAHYSAGWVNYYGYFAGGRFNCLAYHDWPEGGTPIWLDHDPYGLNDLPFPDVKEGIALAFWCAGDKPSTPAEWDKVIAQLKGLANTPTDSVGLGEFMVELVRKKAHLAVINSEYNPGLYRETYFPTVVVEPSMTTEQANRVIAETELGYDPASLEFHFAIYLLSEGVNELIPTSYYLEYARSTGQEDLNDAGERLKDVRYAVYNYLK